MHGNTIFSACNQWVPSSTLGAGTIYQKARSVSKRFGFFCICYFSSRFSPYFFSPHFFSTSAEIKQDNQHWPRVCYRVFSRASIFIIRRIKVSFWLGADSATSRVRAASPVSFTTGSPSASSRRWLRCRKSTNRKAPLRLLPSVNGWFFTTK